MKIKTLSGALLSFAILASSVGNSVACTVLAMKDAKGNVYQARSNEHVGQQPDALTYYPPGTRIESVTPDGKQGKTFNTKYAIFGATLKGMKPNANKEMGYSYKHICIGTNNIHEAFDRAVKSGAAIGV